MPDVLSRRELNRATLERQLLLRRAAMPPLEAVRHLVGMQAQVPLNPYTGLWSRLEGFRPEEVGRLLEGRQLVRVVVMRGTIHLVTAEDALLLRPLMQPVLDGQLKRHSEHRAALAEACRHLLPLVQVPPRGVWGKSKQPTSTTVEAWLGRPLRDDGSIDDVVLRYLGALGPATVADVAGWSRLTGFAEVLERLRPSLRVFRDENGRELFDLPDAPRPGSDVPAPPRFLPEYDNLLLSHADRSRFQSPRARADLSGVSLPIRGTVLEDGYVCGTWRIEGGMLVVDHVVPLSKRAAASIAAEGRRFLRFVEGASGDVRFVAVV